MEIKYQNTISPPTMAYQPLIGYVMPKFNSFVNI